MTDRLALPAAAALALVTLALWLYLLLFQAGVQVANRSGAVIGGLTVCQSGGGCLHRAHLGPHQTWRVPLRAAGAPVRLTVQQAGGGRPSVSHAPRTAGSRPSFVVGQGGRIEVQ